MDDGFIREFLYSQEANPLIMVFILGGAFILGAIHALGPGHGKSLMAAYLVGSKGTIKDALILALTITISHIFTVIIIGFIALLIMDFFWSEKASLWFGLVSGLLVMIIGIWLFIKRIKVLRNQPKGARISKSGKGIEIKPYNQSKASVNSHDSNDKKGMDGRDTYLNIHHPTHHHYDPNISIFSNIILGVSSGIVPCPKALVILLLAISLQKVMLGVVIISVFSLGMALVLVTIGIVLVKASHLLSHKFQDSRIQVIPIVGSVFIILLGIVMTIRTLQIL